MYTKRFESRKALYNVIILKTVVKNSLMSLISVGIIYFEQSPSTVYAEQHIKTQQKHLVSFLNIVLTGIFHSDKHTTSYTQGPTSQNDMNSKASSSDKKFKPHIFPGEKIRVN